jgi:hypothetical protein
MAYQDPLTPVLRHGPTPTIAALRLTWGQVHTPSRLTSSRTLRASPLARLLYRMPAFLPAFLSRAASLFWLQCFSERPSWRVGGPSARGHRRASEVISQLRRASVQKLTGRQHGNRKGGRWRSFLFTGLPASRMRRDCSVSMIPAPISSFRIRLPIPVFIAFSVSLSDGLAENHNMDLQE